MARRTDRVKTVPAVRGSRRKYDPVDPTDVRPSHERRWTPSDRCVRFLQATIKLGFDASKKARAVEAGVPPHAVYKWYSHESFVRWLNAEVMRHMTASIPVNASYALKSWIEAVADRARNGRPPTNDEMDRVIKICDRFNVSIHVPEVQEKVEVTINLTPPKDEEEEVVFVDEEYMLPPPKEKA